MSMEEQTPQENLPVADVPIPANTPESELPPEETTIPQSSNENDRLLAALAYATQIVIPIIVPAIVLLSAENKQRPFQRYHAIQSLGFLVAAVLYEVLATIVFVALTVISLGCLSCILWLLFLLPIVPALYYAYEAYQGKYFEIPAVTEFMIQNKWLEKPAA